jgi:hypothetical protein
VSDSVTQRCSVSTQNRAGTASRFDTTPLGSNRSLGDGHRRRRTRPQRWRVRATVPSGLPPLPGRTPPVDLRGRRQGTCLCIRPRGNELSAIAVPSSRAGSWGNRLRLSWGGARKMISLIVCTRNRVQQLRRMLSGL